MPSCIIWRLPESWGYANYKGKSQSKMDDLGVRPFLETPNIACVGLDGIIYTWGFPWPWGYPKMAWCIMEKNPI